MVDCSGLENRAVKALKTSEMPGFCGFRAAHDARFALRSPCCDGYNVGTDREFYRHLGFIQMRDHYRKHLRMPVVIESPPPPPLPEPKPVSVDEWPDLYFIGCDEGPIKIGISVDPVKRLRQLQTAYPYKLRLLAIVKEGCRLEPEYHARFAMHRLEGEWFERHPDILAEIDRLNTITDTFGNRKLGVQEKTDE